MEIINLLKDKPFYYKKFQKFESNLFKYDIFERIYNLSYFFDEFKKDIENSDLTKTHKQNIIEELYNYQRIKTNSIKTKIKTIFNIFNSEKYLLTDKSTILSNHKLLGLAPLLFTEKDFMKIIFHDIRNFGIEPGVLSIYHLITDSLNEHLLRLNKNEYHGLKNWSKETITTSEIMEETLGLTEINDIQISKKEREKKFQEILLDQIDRKIHQRKNLSKDYTQKDLIELISNKIIKNHTLSVSLKNAIKNFVYKNFKNLKGKNGTYKYADSNMELANYINELKTILGKILFKINCDQKEISKIISSYFQNVKSIKTIENI